MTERLVIGSAMTLAKQLRTEEANAEVVPRGRHLPSWRRVSSGRVPPPRSFEYVYSREGGEVALEDAGLQQLYLVLGAPGTGKSYFLRKLLDQLANDAQWSMPWGGLLLDPKQTLVHDVKASIPPERRLVIGPGAGTTMNLLASHLEPTDLGTAIALAAQSSGISASDPYWINEMKRLFGDGLAVIKLLERPMTLRRLATLFLTSTRTWSDRKKKTEERSMLKTQLDRLRNAKLSEADARRRDAIISSLTDYETAKSDNAHTVRTFIRQILAPFLDPDLDFLSDDTVTDTVGDHVLRDARWLILDVPKSRLAVSRFLSTLVKVLFASAALNRKQLYPDNERRVFLVVDEYAEVASDLPGEGFGDSYFFSQARQFKVLSFIATQGIPMLENSGVRETWKSILTNSAGKLMFRLGDPDSAELAAKMMGESDVVMSGRSASHGQDGASVSADRKMDRWTTLSSDLFITGLELGHLVFMGLTDGMGRAKIQFVKVER